MRFCCDHKADERVNTFKSDFKIVADYFVQVRKTGKYIPMPEDVTHVWEMMNLMSVLTEDDRFEKSVIDLKGKESVNMCEVIDSYINQGYNQGISQGYNQGITHHSNQTILKLYGKLGNTKQVADLLDLSEAEVEAVISAHMS